MVGDVIFQAQAGFLVQDLEHLLGGGVTKG
jgi:hypothetical protein